MRWSLRRLLNYFLYVASGAVVLATGFVVYLIWFQPAFYFPKPTGQYAVGVQHFHWVDNERKELFNNDSAHSHREFMVKIWYPATGTVPDKPAASYSPHLVAYLKKNHKLMWLLGFSRPVYSYAQQGATIVSDIPQFPVILFSHGRGGANYESYTAHCEELASHGYVVVGINHTYCSLFTQFPDGRTIDGRKAIQKRRTGTNFTQLKQELDQELGVWIADVQFVLNQLEKITSDRESFFYKRFDLNNIGMFGHSLGGAAAVHLCRRDARVKAGVNLDGGLFGYDVVKPFDKPFMFMLNEKVVKGVHKPMSQHVREDFKISSPEEEKTFNDVAFFSIVKLAQSLGRDTYAFFIKDTNHMDFSDLALLKHSSRFLRILTGPIDGFRATEIVRDYLVNFFNKYLKGQRSELLDGKSNVYHEVEEVVRRKME